MVRLVIGLVMLCLSLRLAVPICVRVGMQRVQLAVSWYGQLCVLYGLQIIIVAAAIQIRALGKPVAH